MWVFPSARVLAGVVVREVVKPAGLAVGFWPGCFSNTELVSERVCMYVCV